MPRDPPEARPGQLRDLHGEDVQPSFEFPGCPRTAGRLGGSNDPVRKGPLLVGVDAGGNQGSDQLGHAVLNSAHRIRHVFVAPICALEQQEEGGTIVGDEVEVSADSDLDLPAGRIGSRCPIRDRPGHPIAYVINEVQVKGAF